MANFDTNHWYQIVLSSGSSQSLDGSVLYDAGTGATFFKETNISFPEQKWQLFPINSTYYVLRTLASGPHGYLNAAISINETTLGKTVPDMRNSTLSDESMYWQVSPWSDGTFYLTNKANGSDWHLDVKSNSLMAMSSNITAPQTKQQFSFNQLGTIDNTAFSSVVTLTASATGSSTSTGSGSKQTQPSSNGSGGLSTGAKAAIGASIGAVTLFLLLFLGFFIMKRRRSNIPREVYLPESDSRPPEKQPYGEEMYGDPQEMGGRPAAVELGEQHQGAELEGITSPVELPAHNR